MSKTITVDTSVIVNDRRSLLVLGDVDNAVELPFCVLQELDKLKVIPGLKGYVARGATEFLETLQEKRCGNEIPLNNSGAKIVIDMTPDDELFRDFPYLERTNDNRIILTGRKYHAENERNILVSDDRMMRIFSRVLGVPAEDYNKNKFITSPEELYSGFVRREVAPELLVELQISGEVNASADFYELHPNTCCYLYNGDKYALGLFKKAAGKIRNVKTPEQWRKEGARVVPKNIEQCFAYAIAVDPGIRYAYFSGVAGGGKSLMALSAGYNGCSLKNGRRLWQGVEVFRAIQEVGKALGYLPGNVDEKIAPYKVAVEDLLSVIVGVDRFEDKDGDDRFHRGKDRLPKTPVQAVLESGIIDISPINYILGRTLLERFVMVDEAQNFGQDEMDAIVTRLGHGSKMVFTGDTRQIFNRFVDPVSNGMVYAIHALMGEEYFATIMMTKSERDPVIESVIARLKKARG